MDVIRTIAVHACAGVLIFGSPFATAANQLTDLGAVAPGLGINNSGQVVLQSYFYGNGALTAFPANFTGAGINSSGQVVGAATLQGPCPATNVPFGVSPCIAVWAGGTLTIYPGDEGFPDYVGNYGLGINSSGQIVGYWHATEIHDYTGAILLSNGVFSDLRFPYPPGGACPILYPATTFGPPNHAYAINDAGQIAGQMQRSNADQSAVCVEAFFYSQGTYTDIGAGAALALNATGQVVGVLQSQPTVAHAFLYDPSGAGPAKDLGTLAGQTHSSASAINALSLVVGESDSGADTTAFFYNGVMNDLNVFVNVSDPLQPYVKLTDARGINDSGVVVVNGVDSRDKLDHAYLLQVPFIQVTPGPLTFSTQPINTTSPPQTVTFTNIGTAAMTLGTASVTGSFNVQSNDCSSSLAPSAGCNISVTYTPTTAGNPTGGLALIAADVPIVVPLTGASALSASISASAATVTAGTAVTLTWNSSPGAICTATGGSAADGWTGNVATSGSKAVTENTAGTYSYGLDCTAGSQTQSPATTVMVAWPAVTVTLSASPTSIVAGNSTTLTWSSAHATSCTASGGGPGDTWPGSKATSGSAAVTEAYAISAPSVTLTYTLTCTSSASKLSGQTSANVTETKASSGGGGGGAFDPTSLTLLLAIWCCVTIAPVNRVLNHRAVRRTVRVMRLAAEPIWHAAVMKACRRFMRVVSGRGLQWPAQCRWNPCGRVRHGLQSRSSPR